MRSCTSSSRISLPRATIIGGHKCWPHFAEEPNRELAPACVYFIYLCSEVRRTFGHRCPAVEIHCAQSYY